MSEFSLDDIDELRAALEEDTSWALTIADEICAGVIAEAATGVHDGQRRLLAAEYLGVRDRMRQARSAIRVAVAG